MGYIYTAPSTLLLTLSSSVTIIQPWMHGRRDTDPQRVREGAPRGEKGPSLKGISLLANFDRKGKIIGNHDREHARVSRILRCVAKDR